jgi:hypothetical protein
MVTNATLTELWSTWKIAREEFPRQTSNENPFLDLSCSRSVRAAPELLASPR